MFQSFSDPNHNFQVANSIFKDIFFFFCVKSLQLYFISKLKSVRNFPPEKKWKKYMAPVAREIDETSNAVQLNGFFGKTFYFFNLFSQSATSPVY